MKKNTGIHILQQMIPILFLLVLLFSAPVSAAAPGKVTNLKASVKENTIKLSWKKVTGAAGYNIYSVEKDGTTKLIKKTTKTSYTKSGCRYGQKYTFKVRAYKSAAEVGAFSKTVSAMPTIKVPRTPSGFRVESLGNGKVTLMWNRTMDTKGYVIEKYDSKTKKYVVAKTIYSQTVKRETIANLKAGVTYKLRIKSFNTGKGMRAYSKPSDPVTVKAVNFSDEVNEVRTARYTATVTKKVTAKNLTQKKTITVKKGTKLTVQSKTGATVSAYLKNGDNIKISRAALKYTGLDCSSKNDYSKSQKENFVNAKKIKSDTNVLIWVSQYKLKVNVFRGSAGKWKLVKEMPCVIGRWDSRSSLGLKKILGVGYDPTDGTPKVYFSPGLDGTASDPKGNSFHIKIGNVMSQADSHGCIRLDLDNLLYIKNNCLKGTAVYVF